MERKNINLWEEDKIPFYDEKYHKCESGVNVGACTLTPYLINDDNKHAAIVVFPGGGYVHRSEKEAEPVAQYLNSIGLNAFVLNYRVIPYPPYLGSVDGKRAVKYIRSHARDFNTFEDKIGVMGFSAGAGNACLLTEKYDECDYEPIDDIDNVSAKPNFCIYCYGALSFHLQYLTDDDISNFEKLVPKEMQEAFIKTYSCDELVRENMPPTFIWHAMDDERVKVGACISFVKAMAEKGNDCECHIFAEGGHGKSVIESRQIEGMNQWFELFEKWLVRKALI